MNLLSEDALRTKLSAHDFSEYEFVSYLRQTRRIVYFITAFIFLIMAGGNIFISPDGSFYAVILLPLLLFVLFTFKNIISPKNKNFNFAIGKKGVLFIENHLSFLGSDSTILLPWQNIDYAEPYKKNRQLGQKNIHFANMQKDNQAKETGALPYIIRVPKADYEKVLNLLPKYCTVKS